MARIRTIKPDFFTSEDIVSLSPLARLLYIAVWCEADRDGRLEWKPRTFKIRYFPMDNCDVEALAKELVSNGLVVTYGESLAYVPSFSKHQHINPRESASVLPIPDASARVSTRRHASNLDLTGREEGKGREGKGKEGKEQKKGAVAPLDLPTWLAADVWSEWHNYRNGRKGWTAKARQLSLATLADLYAQGHDPRSVVNKSIECGWTGLFALKQANAPPGHRPSQPSKTFAAIQLLEDMKNGQLGTSSNLGRVPEAPLLELGPDSGDGHDPGYGSRVA